MPSDYPTFERFAGMLSIPYLTSAGPVAMKFRCLECAKCDGHPKYNAPENQQPRLFNVKALQTPGDVVAVCEGEIDALICTELVGIPAVGVPGTSSWQDHWPRAFQDYAQVIVVADNDVKADGSNPGLKAAKKVVNKIPGARLVKPPAGHDVNSWVLEAGADAVREALHV